MYLRIFDCYHNQEKFPIKDFLNKINYNYYEEPSETEICGQNYCDILEEVDVVVRIMRKNWYTLQSSILNESTIPLSELRQIRDTVNKCLELIVQSLKVCTNGAKKQRHVKTTYEHFQMFTPLIVSTSNLDQEIFLKLNNFTDGKERCPIYHYFHEFQDVQFYLLLLHHVSGETKKFRNQIEFVVNDLILLSQRGYKNNSKSAFICECNKHFWLLLQILCEKTLEENSFWLIFNSIAKDFDSQYILWLLKDIAELQAYDLNGNYVGASSERIKDNFTLLENTIKNVVGNITNNTTILTTLRLLEPIMCNLWLKFAKIEMYQILWDYFGKRLNSCIRQDTRMSLTELVELIDAILWNQKNCILDIELFLAMLCMHLKEHPYHWAKMKGRIYSQLGPNKLKDLNNGGIFNVLLLYISLTKSSFEDLSKKFLVFVDNLPMEKKQSQLIWTFYIALLIRHAQENKNMEAAIIPLVKMLEDASTDQKHFYLIKSFVKDFELLIKYSSNLQLHQWLLINTWIHKYMALCYYQDVITLLAVLSNTIDRIIQEHAWCDWESSFKNHVYSSLKYSRNTPEISGTVAAKIALFSPGLMQDAFAFFNSESTAIKISANFLCGVMENYPDSVFLTSQQESTALQTWVKFCLLSRDSYDELTRKIVKLEIIPDFVKSSIISAKDPLCAFIDCIGSNAEHHTQPVTKLCEILFCQTEKWITQYFIQPENDLIILRIYTCLAQAFLKTGPLVYNRHKSNCPFARLVSTILLPTELIMGKSLNTFILQSVRKTWHIFFEAIVKLNSPNDAFIERILREMIIRYMPHFPNVDSPMLKSLNNENTADIILEKISTAYFKQPSKESDSNIYKALRLINDFIQCTTSRFLLQLIVAKCLYGLFEIIMFHNQRSMAISVVTNILASPLHTHIEMDFQSALIQITDKHLAFNTSNYFQLLGNIGKLAPELLRKSIRHVKQSICNVERMRGVGYDKSLRLNMERLEATLSKSQ